MNRLYPILVPLLAFIAGCPPPAGQPPTTRREALERINNNLSHMSGPLHCAALVSFRFRDAEGREHAFLAHEARLLFKAPQSLLFDVRSLAGTVAQFGSNEDVYWLWVDVPDVRKLWWGTWQRVSLTTERKLPIPPNELLDALMLRPLPESLEGGLLPMLRVEGNDQRLIFVRLAGGQPNGWREIRLDPCAPYQPLEVIDRTPDGQVVMHAQIMSYQRVGADGPLTPRRYIVRWPGSGNELRAEMRLDILQASFRAELPSDVFEFPVDWMGESERVDTGPDGAGRP